ncbi:MAG: hypothetical protein Q4F29_03710 [Lachnospiraceae bacterium]|nr:hypothetical protein [Lachnospiraceae bacterium]
MKRERCPAGEKTAGSVFEKSSEPNLPQAVTHIRTKAIFKHALELAKAVQMNYNKAIELFHGYVKLFP